MAEDLIDASARVRTRTTTPLALNESVTTMARVREILAKRAADYLLPDTYQCGGVWATKLVAEVAASAGVPCVVHCAHDLGPKTAAMLHVVASTPNFTLANDCTYYGLVDDIITPLHRLEELGPDVVGVGHVEFAAQRDAQPVRRFADNNPSHRSRRE